ncbi:MAG: hypothetical protein AABX71_01630 [Nanoarchaeota archaeon]
MRKLLVFLLFGMFFIALAGTVYAITPVETESAGISTANLWMGQQTQAGQTFEFSQDLYVYEACVMFKHDGGKEGDVVFGIYDTEYSNKLKGYIPKGNPLTQETMPASEIDKTFKLRCVEFSNPVELDGGKTYALVLSSADPNAKGTYVVRRSGTQNPYTLGAWVRKNNDKAAWQIPGKKFDLVFSVSGGFLPPVIPEFTTFSAVIVFLMAGLLFFVIRKH